MLLAAVRSTRSPPQRHARTLAQICATARRQQIEASQLFHCRKLMGHSSFIGAMEFFEDGAVLVSGGETKPFDCGHLIKAAMEEE